MVKFGKILEEVRRKPYDLLDTSQTIFERDYLEFNVHISDLETAVQVITIPCFSMTEEDSMHSDRLDLHGESQHSLSKDFHSCSCLVNARL